MADKKFAFHPGCKSLSLMHLCFVDDLMVFVEGSRKSVEGALSVFEAFESWSGLSISLEKSTIYMAGVTEAERRSILKHFPFAVGELPVRYLGLPLMTQAMRKQDYLPLFEKIRSRICSWTCRFLSYAGRLQLISSVLMSLANFWTAVFRLPSACIKEVEQICAAFLWTGPTLKTTSAKVAWRDVCCRKSEGGLGIRDLKEVNKVYGLKLIWRMLTGESLWGKWIKTNLFKGKNFWEVNSTMQNGSWMWHKMLKMRTVAKTFYKKELGNGRHVSLWFDNWSVKGSLFDLLGPRGIIDMGVSRNATLEEAILNVRRRKRHHIDLLNDIEEELKIIESKLGPEKVDISVWRGKSGFKQRYSSHETWLLLQESKSQCSWSRGIWFPQATPKFAFMAWLSIKNRMSTLDRVARWNQGVDKTCVLCKNATETRSHLFFECGYSTQIWEYIVKGILGTSCTNVWSEIVSIISDEKRDKMSRFCIRYAFQSVLYAVWRERNKLIHGDKLMPLPAIKKMVDKGIRNKITLMRRDGIKGMENLMQFWFLTRI